MIHYIKGDIFNSEAQALVNTVNTVGVMGKGIALQFKEHFPDNYVKYKKACKESLIKTGNMFITEENPLFGQNKIIINFPTKTHWRFPSEYQYIKEGLVDLKDNIIARGIKSVALPPLGTNNGGLDWGTVRQMVEDTLKDLDCEIFVYIPNNEIAERMKSERVKLTTARALLILMLSEMIKEGEFASLFAAEKMVYFLQKFGAKKYFNIDFEPYYYGPYSGGKIAHVLYKMNGSYISGMSAMNNKPLDIIWLTQDAEDEAKKFLDEVKDQKVWEILKKTTQFLTGYYSSLSLELLSTTDYILSNTPQLKHHGIYNDKTLQEEVEKQIKNWGPRKARILTAEYITLALAHLKLYDPNFLPKS